MTKKDLIVGLREAGYSNGDVVFLHSSLKSLDHMEDGANGVIDSFIEVIGSAGLLIVPTHTGCYSHLNPVKYFDPESTRCSTGKIPDTFWRRNDALRSLHPTHSMAAIGSRAAELIKGHENTSTFGIDGPHGGYFKWNAKITFLGVWIGCNTTLHAIEDWTNIPYMPTAKARVLNKSTGKIEEVDTFKSPFFHRNFYMLNSKLEMRIREKGIIRDQMIGPSQIQTMLAQDVVELTLQILKKESNILLCDTCDRDCNKSKETLKGWKPTDFNL